MTVAKRKREEVTVENGNNESVDVEENAYSDGFDESEEDEDMASDDGDGDDLASSATGSKQQLQKKKKPKAAHLADDLRNLQEAVQLYKSNIFKLEIDELLKELKVDETKTKAVDRVLHKLKDFIEAIPDSKQDLMLSDAEKTISKSGIAIPFPDPKPPKDAQYRFAYSTPSDFNLVGSYALKTMIKSPERFAIDVVVDMPAALFTEKDTLNYRYFHKRAFYLAYIAAAFKNSEQLNFDLSYEFLDGDHLRPVLRLDSLKDGSESDFHKAKCYIRIVPGIAKDTFPISKLSPARNCVRYASVSPQQQLKPTPYYNSSILSDTQHFSSTVFINKAIKSSDGFRDAVKLGDIWLRQRGFSSATAGFGAAEWAVLMAALLVGGGARGSKVLANGFSNYQLFKATLGYVASTDIAETPVAVGVEGIDFDKSVFDGRPVLVQNDVNLNVLYRMSPSDYSKFRHEAALTVKELDDVNGDHFDSVFLEKVDSVIYQSDLTFCAKFPPEDKSFRDLGRVFNPSYYGYLSARVYEVLKQGLGERVDLISVRATENFKFAVESRKPSSSGEPAFTIGLLLNPEHSERLVIHGPSAEDKQASAEFRKFWGRKSELRRFKDGSITESVVWEPRAEESVVTQIVRYVLERHVGEAMTKGLYVVGDGLNKMFAQDRELADAPGTNAIALYQKNLDEFDLLRKMLIDIDDLPLKVSAVLPASERLRYASVRPPVEFSVHSSEDFSNVVIELETSAKWPDDLKAVQHSKAAFLLGIGQSLCRMDPTVVTNTGLDRDPDTIENFAFLDVLMPSGYAFRVRLRTEREAAMLRNYKPDRDLGLRGFKTLEREFTLAARHTTEFATLCHRYPFLSGTVRRVKKWLHAHYLSDHFDAVTVEMLTLAVFLKPFPWSAPASSYTGFLRVLYFLAHWDWRSEPLILDVDQTLTIADVQGVREKFKQQRANDPELSQGALFIAINYERSGMMWTQPNPRKVIASRMTALARASCAALKSGGVVFGGEADEFRKLFVSPVEDFDFVIYLEKIPAEESAYPPGVEQLNEPVELYFKELESVFDGAAVFFRNRLRNDVIAGVWDPRIMAERSWKVYLGYSTRPVQEEGVEQKGTATVRANVDGMVREMERLGGDLVREVVRRA
ncbi:Nrap protein [Myxozyma melibiosi]|uniref:U3 small nucleolar RNA-associated protein 22 n=1 Tax=Myxozyma melibiosi TaxID=54550 RepID=A0ABR1FCI1_9ASCO